MQISATHLAWVISEKAPQPRANGELLRIDVTPQAPIARVMDSGPVNIEPPQIIELRACWRIGHKGRFLDWMIEL